MSQGGLFGPDEATAAQRDVGRFRAASVTWARLYDERYKKAYRWRKRCNRHIADIIRECPDVDEFGRIAAAYLADKWQGYAGHELRYLARDLTRFKAIAEQSHRRNDQGTARRASGQRGDAVL